LIELGEGCTPWRYHSTRSTSDVPRIDLQRYLVGVSFHGRPRSCRDCPPPRVSLRRTFAPRGLPPQAPRWHRHTAGDLQDQIQLLLQSRRVPETDHTPIRAVPRPKIYLGAFIVLISAMRHGPTPRRVRELASLFGVDRRTIARWEKFWREHFPQTHFWKTAGARVILLADVATLPLSLVNAFHVRYDDCDGWGRLLSFLSPITTATGPPS
jgi:hypothetical protein